MLIFIKGLTTRDISIECELGDSIEYIKQLISGKLDNIHILFIKLIWSGKELKTGYILSDYNFTNQDHSIYYRINEIRDKYNEMLLQLAIDRLTYAKIIKYTTNRNIYTFNPDIMTDTPINYMIINYGLNRYIETINGKMLRRTQTIMFLENDLDSHYILNLTNDNIRDENNIELLNNLKISFD